MVKHRERGRPPHDDILTPGEWRIVHAVQHGMTDREIAARRGISRDAVKFHVANAIAKLGLRDRKALRQWFRAPGASEPQLRSNTIGSITAARIRALASR
jgi:DNA-binding NarL/FixJ family response regulator